MFDFVRTHTRLFQILLALLVFPSFILFGVQGYSRFSEGRANTVAKVDGHDVSKQEFDAAHQQQIERIRQQAPTVDVKQLDTPQARQQVLDNLLRQRVMLAAVDHLHLGVTDAQLVNFMRTSPEFAPVRDANGNLDRARYEAILNAQGKSAAGFEAEIRQQLALQRVVAGIGGSGTAPASVARAGLDPLLQRREVQLQRFDTQDYLAKVNPTDDEIKAYYDNAAHQAQFKAPEQASIEYVVLDLEALKKSVTVSDKDLKDYYEQNKGRYGVPEERRAAHILVKADKSMPEAERAKAKAKAEALLAEVRKNPASFAEVAKKNSDDPGSKDSGGELGFFARDAMVKPFSDAAFSLKPGEISNVVESDFGYHIIKVEEARGGAVKPFEEVRGSVEDEVKRQLAQRKYAEAAESFTNTVYEQPDSLQPVVDKLKLGKQTATVQHAVQPAGAGPLASQRFIDALFNGENIRSKRNTEAIEFGPNQMVSGRVVQYTPAHVLPLAEVKDAVRTRVATEKAAALARKDGEARLAQLKSGGEAAGLAQPVELSRAKTEGQPQPVVDAVLRADASKLPATLGVDLGDAGYTVVRINKVNAPDPASDEMKSLTPRYAQIWAAAETQAYLAALKTRYKAELTDEGRKIESANAEAASAPAR